MIITLVRHGEVQEAYQQCYNGHNDIFLSAQGIGDAKKVGNLFQQQHFDAIYSSDLRRCQESTQHLITPSSHPSVIYTPKLREKSWGRHEGMRFDDIVKRDGLLYEDFEQWIKALDGEDYGAYIARIKHFFTVELPQTKANTVLVITHAGVIRVLMHLLQNISLEEAFSTSFPYSAYITLDTDNWTFGELVCVS